MLSLLSLFVLLCVLQRTYAHYRFTALIINGDYTDDWQYVRNHTNWRYPIESANITSTDLRCNVGAPSNVVGTAAVSAGDELGFTIDPYIFHDGVLNVYMAKAPGQVSDFDGSGDVWFKIYEIQPVLDGGQTITFTTYNATEFRFNIPKTIEDGEYLLRIEHIALHLANYLGRTEFYVGCAQISVTGGGKANPSKVAIPDVYTEMDPGIFVNIYMPIPTTYAQPGPTPFVDP